MVYAIIMVVSFISGFALCAMLTAGSNEDAYRRGLIDGKDVDGKGE